MARPPATGPSPARRGRQPRRRLVAGFLALGLVGSACVDDDEAPSAQPSAQPSATTAVEGEPGDLVLAVALRTTGSCDALLAALKAEALERVGPWGLGGGGWYGPLRMAAEADDATAPAAAADGDAMGGGEDHSATNTQEAGVDEADAVKTDGRRLVAVSGSTVRVLDVSGGSPVLQHTIDLPPGIHGGELFLDGDRAVLLSTTWEAMPVTDDDASRPLVPAGAPSSRIIEVDLAAGQVVGGVEVEGTYLSARSTGGVVRAVLSRPGPSLPFLHPAGPDAEDAAEAANRQVIERSTIEDWLPSARPLGADGQPTGEGPPIVPCERFHLPEDFAGFGVVTVLSIAHGASVTAGDAVAVLTDGQTVYASTDRLVLATPRWVDPQVWDSGDEALIREASEGYATALHTFDISDPAALAYAASGSVAGRIVNQFALDEHDGLIRVATTEGELWGDEPDSESFVTVLDEVGQRLEPVGRVGGLGPGEQIHSVRFADDVAYVVTFRQTDPFYVVDLADPSAPRVVGELKIPGFSRYLHPISETVVVGVGQDATDDGRVTGAQVSVFDVADPTDPQRIAQLALGEDSWSLAAEDHRAFLWWAPERLAVLPLSQWRWDDGTDTEENFDGAVVVRVGTDGQMAEVGRLSHPTLEECFGYGIDPYEGSPGDEPAGDPAISEDCYVRQPPISRSVVVGDTLYTVSDGGVLASALADLGPRGFAAFDR
jgi:hypothetical protein